MKMLLFLLTWALLSFSGCDEESKQGFVDGVARDIERTKSECISAISAKPLETLDSLLEKNHDGLIAYAKDPTAEVSTALLAALQSDGLKVKIEPIIVLNEGGLYEQRLGMTLTYAQVDSTFVYVKDGDEEKIELSGSWSAAIEFEEHTDQAGAHKLRGRQECSAPGLHFRVEPDWTVGEGMRTTLAGEDFFAQHGEVNLSFKVSGDSAVACRASTCESVKSLSGLSSPTAFGSIPVTPAALNSLVNDLEEFYFEARKTNRDLDVVPSGNASGRTVNEP